MLAAFDSTARLVRWQPLAGGISASVHRLDYMDGAGRPQRVVVRCHSEIDHSRNNRLAADEAALLRALYECGVAVPEPLFVVENEELLDRPFLIQRFIDNAEVVLGAEFSKRAAFVADWLANLHSETLQRRLRNCLQGVLRLDEVAYPARQLLGRQIRDPDELIFEARIRDLLMSLRSPRAVGADVLLHGDLWAGNILWRGHEIAAVLDWEDFGIGSPLADVACARLEFLWGSGGDAMKRFTDRYLSQSGLAAVSGVDEALAYWDLCAVLPFAHTLPEIARDAAQLASMREQLANFIDRASARAGVRRGG